LVDGYDPETKTIYEFLGNYWHGNPKLFSPNGVNICNQKTFGELYQDTFDRLHRLKLFGYKIKYVWEQEWDKFIKKKLSYPSIQTL
jgi:hypothetical protein